jgi:hypothetical protein
MKTTTIRFDDEAQRVEIEALIEEAQQPTDREPWE